MARPALRPDEIESFRARLCETAMQMFADDGYDAVTLRALAEKLGCSHALPYRYFADKKEIFAAVCALGFERFAAALERAAAGVDDPEERLRVGKVNLFAAFDVERVMFYVAHDTDDCSPARRQGLDVGYGIDGDTPTNRIAVGPEATGKIRVHDGDERRARVVGAVQQPSTHERNLHGLEVSRSGGSLVDLHVGKIAKLRKLREIADRGIFKVH